MWRTVTEADLLGVLNVRETAKYQESNKGDGQDVFADQSVLTVNFCRGYIADNPENQLATGDTLPERCLLPALWILRVEMLTRLKQTVDEDRRKAMDRAIRFFERVADGKVKIEKPEGVPIDQSSSTQTIETVKSANRKFTRESQRGL